MISIFLFSLLWSCAIGVVLIFWISARYAGDLHHRVLRLEQPQIVLTQPVTTTVSNAPAMIDEERIVIMNQWIFDQLFAPEDDEDAPPVTRH